MRLFFSILKLLIVGVFSSAIAAENYAGIGVALYKSSRGATVAAIAKGSPAASSDLKVGDCIVRVDDTNVKGMNLIEIRNLIRGETLRPISIGVLREGDSLTIDVRRIDMSVLNVKDSAEALNATCYQCELLDFVSTKDKNAGFYVKKAAALEAPAVKKQGSPSKVSLIKMTRKSLRIKTKNADPMKISLFTVDGAFVKSKEVNNAKNGENLIAWDNISLPKGQYVVQIIQNENIFVFSSKL